MICWAVIMKLKFGNFVPVAGCGWAVTSPVFGSTLTPRLAVFLKRGVNFGGRAFVLESSAKAESSALDAGPPRSTWMSYPSSSFQSNLSAIGESLVMPADGNHKHAVMFR